MTKVKMDGVTYEFFFVHSDPAKLLDQSVAGVVDTSKISKGEIGVYRSGLPLLSRYAFSINQEPGIVSWTETCDPEKW